jgi:hypothetical protein
MRCMLLCAPAACVLSGMHSMLWAIIGQGVGMPACGDDRVAGLGQWDLACLSSLVGLGVRYLTCGWWGDHRTVG